MKRILSLSFLLLLAATMFTTVLHAQSGHFDWAKGYGSNQDFCKIKGSVADTEGNLYILGSFTNDDTWDGERLLPITPYGPGYNTINTLIAKISPSGEMLWKKVIHANNGQSTFPYDIKMVGDTAFACMVELSMPRTSNYLYYLDTLIPAGYHDYPIHMESATTTSARFTAFIAFDFSGNVEEQHFLQVSYIDTTGHDFVFNPNKPEAIDKDFLHKATFDIDANGNIYISRHASDHRDSRISVPEGSAIGLKFWVDNQCVGSVDVSNDTHPECVSQLLKFSPHFGTLLNSRYVIQGNADPYYINLSTYTKLDKDNNVYHMCLLQKLREREDTLVIDSLRNMTMPISCFAQNVSLLVKYSPNLTPLWHVYLRDSLLPYGGGSFTNFYDIEFDDDSSLVFLSFLSSRSAYLDTNNFYSIPMYGDVPIRMKSDMGFLVLEQSMQQPRLRAYGTVPSINFSSHDYQPKGNLVCKNNRVFLQSQFAGGVRFPNNEIDLGGLHKKTHGLTVFDYRGKVIGGMHYQTKSSYTLTGPISLIDSILYLSIRLDHESATFGDITLDGPGYFSAVAKYVDTAFMSCYSGGSGDVRIVMAEDGNAFVAYPNPFRQRVNIEYSGQQPITAAYLTDIMGRTEQVELSATAPGRYTLDLTARPQAAYLLTLVTQDGHRHTVRLLKQSEVFGQ